MPSQVGLDDFHQYLPFVNRERQVRQCVSHFAENFDLAYSKSHSGVNAVPETPSPSTQAARKNYEMVVAAGGPGIGQLAALIRFLPWPELLC
jgi:hypothetical protein